MSATTQEKSPRKRTRHEEQVYIDNLRARGQLDQEHWWVLTNELSDVRKWTAAGRLSVE